MFQTTNEITNCQNVGCPCEPDLGNPRIAYHQMVHPTGPLVQNMLKGMLRINKKYLCCNPTEI